MKKKSLRSGYTTGACAAASAKAATQLLIKRFEFLNGLSNHKISQPLEFITITLPEGEKATFEIKKSNLTINEFDIISTASTIKFAGDDPDVTNGAEITAEVVVKINNLIISNPVNDSILINNQNEPLINIEGGRGVGIVTKPGLSVPIGLPAINPVPQKMIKNAILEAFKESGYLTFLPAEVRVIISVQDGERLALKTLNPRLGIIGGISILGTTGVVKPLSSEAWTATITTSMDVAIASGCEDVVVSAGRASEKAHLKCYRLPEESYVMMGDYLEYSLIEAKRHGFKRIHLCSQWAKMLKIAMSTPHTHVRYGAIDINRTVKFLNQIGIILPEGIEFNTAREIFQIINSTFDNPLSAFKNVCLYAQKFAEMIIGGTPVACHLVSYDGEIIVSV